ncbi:MAG: hypothetical protein JSC189_000300 [Candidatus Tokpelaia sp. JSC189]|nr:MAG: hypothetical protein JSC189_000300 [Candidatus Tokpelaia sp. JSC189]
MSRCEDLLNRRQFLRGSIIFALAGLSSCAVETVPPSVFVSNPFFISPPIGVYSAVTTPAFMYGEINENGFYLPPIPYQKIPRAFRRQVVPNITGEAPGIIVIDTKNHFLYFTENEGDAIRYGVGVGKAGFEWSGRASVQYKREWPRWTPPPEMIDRQPELEKYRNGMAPGIINPLGARALYIFQNGVDTSYRIHGSPEWWSIGRSMSSGCIRLINQDIIDLYKRVAIGTPIVVY